MWPEMHQSIANRRSGPCDEVGVRDAGNFDFLKGRFEAGAVEPIGKELRRLEIAIRADGVERNQAADSIVEIIRHDGLP